MCSAKGHARFTPNSGHVQCNSVCPLCADSGLKSNVRASIYADIPRVDYFFPALRFAG